MIGHSWAAIVRTRRRCIKASWSFSDSIVFSMREKVATLPSVCDQFTVHLFWRGSIHRQICSFVCAGSVGVRLFHFSTTEPKYATIDASQLLHRVTSSLSPWPHVRDVLCKSLLPQNGHGSRGVAFIQHFGFTGVSGIMTTASNTRRLRSRKPSMLIGCFVPSGIACWCRSNRPSRMTPMGKPSRKMSVCPSWKQIRNDV